MESAHFSPLNSRRSHDDVVAKEQALITAYKIVFKSDAGKEVLLDLEQRYMRVVYQGTMSNNPLALAFQAGETSVVQRIVNIIKSE